MGEYSITVLQYCNKSSTRGEESKNFFPIDHKKTIFGDSGLAKIRSVLYFLTSKLTMRLTYFVFNLGQNPRNSKICWQWLFELCSVCLFRTSSFSSTAARDGSFEQSWVANVKHHFVRNYDNKNIFFPSSKLYTDELYKHSLWSFLHLSLAEFVQELHTVVTSSPTSFSWTVYCRLCWVLFYILASLSAGTCRWSFCKIIFQFCFLDFKFERKLRWIKMQFWKKLT